jgi:hypothetical protein
MNTIRHTAPFALLAFVTLGLTAPAAAADTSGGDKNELTVFGGISILDAERSAERSFDLPELPWLPVWGGGRPALSVRAGASVGSSALFGARYTRYLKERFAVEADFAVAPTHEAEGHFQLCGAGTCIGRPEYDRAGLAQRWDSAVGGVMGGPMGAGFVGGMSPRFRGNGVLFAPAVRPRMGERDVTAWHYGANATYDVLGGDVRPFLLLGAGGVSYSGAIEGGTDFSLRFGGGLKAWFGRVGLRLDVADSLVVDQQLSGETENDLHATAAVSVKF